MEKGPRKPEIAPQKHELQFLCSIVDKQDPEVKSFILAQLENVPNMIINGFDGRHSYKFEKPETAREDFETALETAQKFIKIDKSYFGEMVLRAEEQNLNPDWLVKKLTEFGAEFPPNADGLPGWSDIVWTWEQYNEVSYMLAEFEHRIEELKAQGKTDKQAINQVNKVADKPEKKFSKKQLEEMGFDLKELKLKLSEAQSSSMIQQGIKSFALKNGYNETTYFALRGAQVGTGPAYDHEQLAHLYKEVKKRIDQEAPEPQAEKEQPEKTAAEAQQIDDAKAGEAEKAPDKAAPKNPPETEEKRAKQDMQKPGNGDRSDSGSASDQGALADEPLPEPEVDDADDVNWYVSNCFTGLSTHLDKKGYELKMLQQRIKDIDDQAKARKAKLQERIDAIINCYGEDITTILKRELEPFKRPVINPETKEQLRDEFGELEWKYTRTFIDRPGFRLSAVQTGGLSFNAKTYLEEYAAKKPPESWPSIGVLPDPKIHPDPTKGKDFITKLWRISQKKGKDIIPGFVETPVNRFGSFKVGSPKGT